MNISKNQRWLALDILRGLSVIGMLLVINPGAWEQRYAWLNHRDWAGVIHADMIFPTFLFCVGMALPLSLARRLSESATKYHLFLHILWRSFALIIIGILLNAFPAFDWEHVRIPGVLQRIGLCYGIVANLVLVFSNAREISVRPLLITAVIILLGYWMLLAICAAPGALPPAYDSVNSIPAYVDRQLFGLSHLWPYGTTQGVVTYDPEGVLSTLPACVNVIFGVITTLALQHALYKNRAMAGAVAIAILLVVVALVWSQWFPIVKKIWTSSFVLFSGGVSLITLALIHFLLEKFRVEKLLYVVHVFGANALLAFIMAGLIGPMMDVGNAGNSVRSFGFNNLKRILPDPQLASFVYSLIVVGLMFMVLHVCYRKRWFLKL